MSKKRAREDRGASSRDHNESSSTAAKFSELVQARRHDKALAYARKHGSIGAAACQRLPSGESLLHVAARTRGTPVALIDTLVRRGSSVNAADKHGATPLHVAAGVEAVRAIKAAAEAHGQVIDLDAVDSTGLSATDAVAWTMHDEQVLAESDDGAESPSERRQRVIAAHEDEAGATGGGGEAAWEARLREEHMFELGEEGGGGFGWAGGESGFAEEETDWFSEIEAAAAARAAAAPRAARERAEAYAAQRDAERRRWQAAAHEEEAEQARREAEAARNADEARRRAAEAAAAEALAEARALYLAGWAALGARADSAEPLRLREVPWPCGAEEEAFTPDGVARRVLDGGMDGAARRRAVQAELRRWHPDKFVARWGTRILPEERDALLLRIKQVAQCLTELLHRPA